MSTQEIVYITVQVGESDVYRTFTSDYVKFTDPETIGLMVQDMFDTIEKSTEVIKEKQV